jgi:hypothetical protein
MVEKNFFCGNTFLKCNAPKQIQTKDSFLTCPNTPNLDLVAESHLVDNVVRRQLHSQAQLGLSVTRDIVLINIILGIRLATSSHLVALCRHNRHRGIHIKFKEKL